MPVERDHVDSRPAGDKFLGFNLPRSKRDQRDACHMQRMCARHPKVQEKKMRTRS